MSQFRRVIRLTLSCMVMTLSLLQAKEPVATNAPRVAKVRPLLGDERSDPDVVLAHEAYFKKGKEKESLGYYLKAAEKGNSWAAHMVASFYDGTDPQGLKWQLAAATAGLPAAQYWLGSTSAGNLLSEGERHHWLLTLAERKDLVYVGELELQIQAMVDVGRQFLEGRGTQKNLAEAVRWFRAGAVYGQFASNAHSELARCLLHGIGVPRDEVEAYALWQHDYNQNKLRNEQNGGRGIVTEDDELIPLKRTLTPKQLADGDTRVRELASQQILHKRNLRSLGFLGRNPSCEPLPADWPTDFVIISAYTVYSPGGLPTTAAQNVAADKALEDELRSVGYRLHRIADLGGAYYTDYCEPGWAVQLDLPRAAGVGRRYGQKKVYAVSAGRLAIVDCKDGLAEDRGKVYFDPPSTR